MKKILLIPSLLTIGVTPIVSLVGCKPKDPEPDPEPAKCTINIDTMGSCWYSSSILYHNELISVNAGDEIKFVVDVSKYTPTDFGGSGWIDFWDSLSMETGLCLKSISIESIVVNDDIELQEADEGDNTYMLAYDYSEGGYFGINWRCDEVRATKQDTTFEFTIKFVEKPPQFAISWNDDPT